MIIVLTQIYLVAQVCCLPQLCQSVSDKEPKEEAHCREASISNKSYCCLRRVVDISISWGDSNV